MTNQVSDQASSWRNSMQRSFEVEEWKISFRWSHLGQLINHKHGDHSYVSSGGLMLDGCHSTSGEPQSANPPHNGWWCWDRLIIVWWSTINLRPDSNQTFWLANPKTSTASRHSRSLIFAVCGVHGSIVHEHRWSGSRGVVKVWHSLSVEDLIKIPPSGYFCPVYWPKAVCNYRKRYHNTMAEAPPYACRH